MIALGALLVGAMALGVCRGSVDLPLGFVIDSVLAHAGLGPAPGAVPGQETILWSLRMPRVLIAAIVGGGLAVVGAVLQSVFRNPLADAGLLGVGAGAALGAVVAVHQGWATETFLALPLSAFVGAMAAALLVYAVAHASGRPSLYGLLLVGLAVAALASAATSIFLVATEEYRVKAVLFWLAGGLEGRSWPHLLWGGSLVAAGTAILFLMGRVLDVLSLGDDEAVSLGISLHASRLGAMAVAALVAGAATSLAGSVPFVGLVAPHALRPLVGPRSRNLLPAAFLGGALLVVVADLASRTLGADVDLPLGSLTAIVGAPYLLFALRGHEGR